MDSKRQLQIGELIKRNFAPILQEHGRYIYGDAFVSVTSVKVAPDLSMAKIYLSIFNAQDKEAILKSISDHTHLLKQALVQRIKSQVRRIPVIHFFSDDTIDEMFRIDEMFESIKMMYPPSVQEEEE